MFGRPRWEREGRDWPGREASRFPIVEDLRWHVQLMGAGPVVLLLHGTGAATHSWRGLAPLLADRFELIAPDLPGHGFTEAPVAARELSLDGMARALEALLRKLGKSPDLVVGHSAGAAILARMCLDRLISPRALISLNGALLPFPGFMGPLFSSTAKLLAATPFLPYFFAWGASAPEAANRLVRGTGSKIDPAGVELYRRLIASPGHVGSALSMIANWDLESLERDLPGLEQPLYLVVGEKDGAVPPSEARHVRARVPGAEQIDLPRLGHLAHEERPQEIAALIFSLAADSGVLSRGRDLEAVSGSE